MCFIILGRKSIAMYIYIVYVATNTILSYYTMKLINPRYSAVITKPLSNYLIDLQDINKIIWTISADFDH